jgi:hypothetical protein
VLASPGPLAQVASGPGDQGAFTEDFCRWREVGGIEQLARLRVRLIFVVTTSSGASVR